MQFLRTLFWVIAAVALLIFAVQNNGLVTVNLWGGLQADIKIWLLAAGPLLLGFLPTWIVGRVNLWRQRKEVSEAAQRAMQVPTYQMQTGAVPVPSSVPGPATRTTVQPDGVLEVRGSHPPVLPSVTATP